MEEILSYLLHLRFLIVLGFILILLKLNKIYKLLIHIGFSISGRSMDDFFNGMNYNKKNRYYEDQET